MGAADDTLLFCRHAIEDRESKTDKEIVDGTILRLGSSEDMRETIGREIVASIIGDISEGLLGIGNKREKSALNERPEAQTDILRTAITIAPCGREQSVLVAYLGMGKEVETETHLAACALDGDILAQTVVVHLLESTEIIAVSGCSSAG